VDAAVVVAVAAIAGTVAIEAIAATAGKRHNGVELLRGLRALFFCARSPFSFWVSPRCEIHSLGQFFLDKPRRCVYYPREFAERCLPAALTARLPALRRDALPRSRRRNLPWVAVFDTPGQETHWCLLACAISGDTRRGMAGAKTEDLEGNLGPRERIQLGTVKKS